MKEQMKEKGITLIALAITVIVMLILAGVTINLITGNNGMLFNANKSKSQTEIDEEKKILKASVLSAMGADSVANLTNDNLTNALDKNVDKQYKLEQKYNQNYGTVYEVTFNKTGNTYTVLEDGTILDKDEITEDAVIAIKPNSIPTLEIDSKQEIEAIVGSNVTSTIKWKSSNDNVVQIETNETTDKKVIVKGISKGTAVIEASVEVKSGDVTKTKTATCKINVTDKYNDVIKSINLSINNAIIDLGSNTKTIQLNATLSSDANQTDTKLTWISSNPEIADVRDDGLVTGYKNGTTIITVKTDNGKKDQCIVTVQTSPTQIIIEEVVENSNINLPLGNVILDLTDEKVAPKSKNVSVKYIPDTTNVNMDIIWSSSDNNIATIKGDGTNSKNGYILGLKNGKATITAKTGNGISTTCEVTVQTSPTQITLDKTNVKLDVTSAPTQSLTVNYIPDETNASMGIKWTSSNPDVVSVVETGKTTTITGKANGEATIRATTENGKTADCKVLVQTSPISIKLNQTKVTLDLTGTNTVQLVVAEYNPVTSNVNKEITWKSNNTGKATVEQNGLVTGKANGEATITATTANGKTATCEAKVQTSPTEIRLSKTSVLLDVNGINSEKISVTYIPETSNVNRKITWASIKTDIATVIDSEIDSINGTITGVKSGTTTITATTANGKTATCEAKVQTSPASITLDKTNMNLFVNGNDTGTLSVTYNPTNSDVNKEITWESSNTSVVTVSNGTVKGIKSGTATITATTKNGKKATCNVVVKTNPISITVSQKNITLDINGNKTASLTVTYNPTYSDANKEITWSSNNTGVATVSNGKVTAVKSGTATITATTANGKQDTCQVTVKTSPASITVSPSTLNLDINLDGKKTADLTVTYNPTNSDVNKEIAWSSNNTGVATVSNGKVTAVKSGTATITAKTANGKTATCTVTVTTSPSGITLNKPKATIDISKTATLQLQATLSPTGLVDTNKTVTWTSSNPNAATVSSSGLVTGKIPNQTVIITATSQNGHVAQCPVVIEASITKLEVSPNNKTLEIGEQTKLDVKITPSNTTEKVTWISSNTSVATVDVNTGLVTAKNPGIVTITAKNSTSTIKSECTVTVNNPKTSSTEINSSFYGALVTNYHGPNDDNMKYRIFYADGTNVYLIADDYIHYTKAPKVTYYDNDTNTSKQDYIRYTYGYYRINLEFDRMNDIQESELYAPYSEDYLKNKREWNTLYKGEFADYAQGAPTLEMYLSSYNQTHGTNITATTDGGTNTSIYLNSNHVTKYEIPAIEDYNGIYLKLDKSKAYAMYLATASGSDYIWTVGTYVELKNEKVGFEWAFPGGWGRTGIRPIICLNSSVVFNKNADGSYTISY